MSCEHQFMEKQIIQARNQNNITSEIKLHEEYIYTELESNVIYYLINPIPPSELGLNLIPQNIIQQCGIEKSTSSGSDQKPFRVPNNYGVLTKIATNLKLAAAVRIPFFQFFNIHLPYCNYKLNNPRIQQKLGGKVTRTQTLIQQL